MVIRRLSPDLFRGSAKLRLISEGYRAAGENDRSFMVIGRYYS